MAAFQDKAVENRLHSSRARIVTPTEGCILSSVQHLLYSEHTEDGHQDLKNTSPSLFV